MSKNVNLSDLRTIRRRLHLAANARSFQESGELLDLAIKRTDRLLKRMETAAATLGQKGGRKTAERGPDYFRQIAAMRKTRAGGRPRKQPESSQP